MQIDAVHFKTLGGVEVSEFGVGRRLTSVNIQTHALHSPRVLAAFTQFDAGAVSSTQHKVNPTHILSNIKQEMPL